MHSIYMGGEVHNMILRIKAEFIRHCEVLVAHRRMSHGHWSPARWWHTLWALARLPYLLYLVTKLPEPIVCETLKSNDIALITIRDEFFHWEDNPGRDRAFRLLWKAFIIIYIYDAYYRDRIDFVIERLVFFYNTGRWTPRGNNRPRVTCWREFDERRASIQASKKSVIRRAASAASVGT